MKITNIYLKRLLKKVFIYTFAASLIAVSISTINIYYPKVGKSFDNKIKDYMFNFRGEKEDSKNVIIIDIDEKSLSILGQWPWSRDKVATILNNLTKAGVAVIGLDIVFAEEDQSSPVKVLAKLNIVKDNIPDFDKELNSMVAKTPTILGYKFTIRKNEFMRRESLHIPAIIIEKNKEKGSDKLLKANGTILNHKKLQDSAYSCGFFNNTPDDSGVVRSIPLVIKYDDQVYPSLDLEMIRVMTGLNTVFINYSNLGVENIQIGDIKIPTDRHGRLILNYRGKAKTFQYISAVDIYQNNITSDLKNKVVLIGASATGLNDLKATPFDSLYPGVEVHATALDNIIVGNFITYPAWIDGLNLLLIFFFAIITVLFIAFTPFWFNPIALLLILSSSIYYNYFILFYEGIMVNTILPFITIMISALIAIFMDYIFEVKNEQMIKRKFASKVSQDVMDSLLKDSSTELFEPTNKTITVFFSDIRNFTYISEAIGDAKVLLILLNEYFDPMTDIIMKGKGTVDKYIGDAIMAHWNALGEVKDHAQVAVDTAISQILYLAEINKKLKADDRFAVLVKENENIIDIGIGINTGDVIVGEMGSSQRSDYTVIGDTVNVGNRVESLCKYYDAQLSISSITKQQLSKDHIYRFLDHIIVKGKSKPIQIWQVYDYDHGENISTIYGVSKDELEEELALYHRAIFLYQDASFEDALSILEEINKKENKTNNNIYNIYISRCKEYIKNPPTNFDSIYKFKG